MDITDTKGLRQLVKDWAERVVVLQNEDGSLASGIAWRKGYVVTADEAVGDHVKIVAAGGRGIAAELAGRDPSTDIALFKADVDPHPLEAAAAVEPGDFALAIGRIVVKLDKDGPGAAAGLLVGDSIVSWNGEAVRGVREIFQQLGPDSVGTRIALGILRTNQPAVIDIVVGERPHK